MAERRMFAKSVIDSDLFLDMPMTAQALYFHLAMRADDDGFVNNPRKIQRMIGASDDDCRILIAKQFIIPFDSGIVVIRHWRIHNYIQKDRYTPTLYEHEKAQIAPDQSGAYVSTLDTECIQDVSTLETQVRLGKDRIGKVRLEGESKAKRKRFTPPTLDEVAAYCNERHNSISPAAFMDYYEARGWKYGTGKPMADWKAAIRTWERRDKPGSQSAKQEKTAAQAYHEIFAGMTGGGIG